MPPRITLPAHLGTTFAVSSARAARVGEGRLRGADLSRPFHGVRTVALPPRVAEDVYQQRRDEQRASAAAYAVRMRPVEFFIRDTAAHLWGGPVPLCEEREDPIPLDVGVHDNAPLPRAAGVHGRRLRSHLTTVVEHAGIMLSSPASTWAMLSDWNLIDLVALGDFFCRVWREGIGRRDVGRPPFTTPERLRSALEVGRRRHAGRLRNALCLIRCDSWSPRESACRVHLVLAGLPEPELNIDVFDQTGRFLACVDLAYPMQRVAIEYQSAMHSAQYAQDIERIERMRADGWIVIQVTSALLADPPALVARVAAALRSRGWRA